MTFHSFSNLLQANKTLSLLTFLLLLVGLFSAVSFAQTSRPTALVVTDSFKEQYLSPYLKKHTQGISKENIGPVLRPHSVDSSSSFSTNVVSTEIYPLGLGKEKNWLSFEILNKASKENWYLDFGHFFSGRFGFLKHLEIMVINFDKTVLYHETVSKKQSDPFIPLILPTDKRSIVVIGTSGHAGLPTTVPLKLISFDQIENIKNNRRSIKTLALFLSVSMIAFFIALKISNGSSAFTFLATYYFLLSLGVYIEDKLFFFLPYVSGFLIPLLLAVISAASLFVQ
ncbi:MAG: hypothetical protein AAF988_04890, partial [Pseudomonadota bacterium]